MDKGESIFLREYLVSKAKQTMPISARCNLHCFFCSNYNNPFPVTKNIFRELEDIKINIPLLEPLDRTINISDCIPGRIVEGETLLHPQFFKVLELIRNEFGRGVTIEFFANGTLLTEDFIRELLIYKPVRIRTLSLNSSNLVFWQRISGSTKKQGEIAIRSVKLLKKYFIPFDGSIVVLPEVTGWDGLEKTIAYFCEYDVRQIIIWHPGYSQIVPSKIRRKMRCSFYELTEFIIRMRKKYKRQINLFPDLLEPSLLNIEEIMESTGALGKKNVLWLVSEATCKKMEFRIKKFLPYVWNNHYIWPVKNLTYGGNIIVSGLLMVSDFIRATKEFLKTNPNIDLILIPPEPFDAIGRDLLYTPFFKIEEEVGIPVKMVKERKYG